MKTIAMMLCLLSAPDAQKIDDSIPKIIVGGEILSMDGEVVTISFDADPDASTPQASKGSADGKWIRVFQSAAAAKIDREETERMIARPAELTLRRTVSGRLLVVGWRPAKTPTRVEVASIESQHP